jgi:hypothetical protein
VDGSRRCLEAVLDIDADVPPARQHLHEFDLFMVEISSQANWEISYCECLSEALRNARYTRPTKEEVGMTLD